MKTVDDVIDSVAMAMTQTLPGHGISLDNFRVLARAAIEELAEEGEMMEWCEVETKGKRIPKWARRAAFSSDGTVFIPAIIAGGEMEIFLCASYDGTRAIMSGKHIYYPAEWIAREFPAAREAAEKIQQRVREHFGFCRGSASILGTTRDSAAPNDHPTGTKGHENGSK